MTTLRGGKATRQAPSERREKRNTSSPPASKPAKSTRVAAVAGKPGLIAAFIVPGLPHPYLIPDANPGYRRLRDAFEAVRAELDRLKPDLLLIYSTQWLSVVGHQVQARPAPEWNHVDPEWHELGSIPYKLRMDAQFGESFVANGRKRGLEMRTVAYHGFPIDTGTVVALKSLNPDNKYAASVVSCNMYADRAETIVLGKAARDAALQSGKRVVAIAVTALSNRMHTDIVPFAKDRIHSLKDDEWNRKYLEFLGKGRLEDASQLAREFSTQANGDQRMKAIWWLSSVMGANNQYDGRVFAYESIYGTGAALVALTPAIKPTADKEFDEDSAETFQGDRNVLSAATAGPGTLNALTMEEGDRWDASHVESQSEATVKVASDTGAVTMGTGLKGSRPPAGKRVGASYQGGVVETAKAPKPLANYAHARRVGDVLYVAGIGPRIPASNDIPGGPVRDAKGKPLKYDVKAQARQCIANIQTVLRESGCDLRDVFDVQVFLIDMQRDFAAFNEIYNETFGPFKPIRTTVEVEALPGPIGVELKVTAQVPRA